MAFLHCVYIALSLRSMLQMMWLDFFFNETCLFCCSEVLFRAHLIKGKEYFYTWYKLLCSVNDYELGFQRALVNYCKCDENFVAPNCLLLGFFFNSNSMSERQADPNFICLATGILYIALDSDIRKPCYGF